MKAIEQLKSKLTVGHFDLGVHSDDKPCTPREAVHDGDTVSVHTKLNFSVRFLAIDTPEISYHLPGNTSFPSIKNPEWQEFLTNPFASKYGPLDLDPGLKSYLMDRLGKDKEDRRKAAMNHYDHADTAQKALEGDVIADQKALGKDFEFFLTFAHEVTDRYGRLLAYINRRDPSPNRPRDYNLRQLEKGMACPYAIWPNVGERACYENLMNLILEPGTANTWAMTDRYLKFTRDKVAAARNAKTGIFKASDPLRLEPFELRYLADRRAPERWVIDLSKNDAVLLAPYNYYKVAMEDRLFVPAEYVALFKMVGWQLEVPAIFKTAPLAAKLAKVG